MSPSFPNATSNEVPPPVARGAGLMSSFRHPWFLCGGWAVDAWLGRQSRGHHDVDIAIFEDSLADVPGLFPGWQLIAHDKTDDSMESWEGRRLYLPAHIHARPGDGFELELCVNARLGSEWLLSRKPRIAVDVVDCAGSAAWGLPTLPPEVVLFYKAQDRRPVDEADFLTLLPHLGDKQRDWLDTALALQDAAHPWLARLIG